MNNVQAAWQMMDEVVELTRKAERRIDWCEQLIAEAQIASTQASDISEKLQELLNKILLEHHE